MSDVRLTLDCCSHVLTDVLGPVEYVRSEKGPGGWVTYHETEIFRQATFVFDGADGELYLEMIVIG